MNSNIVQRIPRIMASIMLLGIFYEAAKNVGLTFL
jgi:hypothetical protein